MAMFMCVCLSVRPSVSNDATSYLFHCAQRVLLLYIQYFVSATDMCGLRTCLLEDADPPAF